MRIHGSTTFVLLALAAVYAPSPALADWPNDPGQIAPIEFVSTAVSTPAAVPDGAGGTFVAWVDSRAGNADIYAQRLDARGNPVWATNGVPVCVATANQENPVLLADGAGGVIVAWEDARLGPQRDIYAMRLLSNGSPDPAWPANGRLLSNTSRDEHSPTMATDGAGGAYVGYDTVFGPTDTDPYATRVLANGTVGTTLTGTGLTSQQQQARVVSDGAGGVILAWRDTRSGPYHIYAQRFVGGVAQWPANGALVYSTTSVLEFDACADGAGGMFTAFPGNLAETYVARTAANGTTLWALSASGSYDGPTNVRVRPDGVGGALVAWINAGNAVAVQRFNGAGSKLWTAAGLRIRNFGVQPGAFAAASPVGSNEVRNVTLVADGEGGAICGWVDNRDLNAARVYAQRVSGTSVVMWTNNGALVSNVYGFTNRLVLVPDGRSGAVAVIAGGSVTSDLGSQRVGRFGQVGLPEPRIVSVKDVPNDEGGRVSVRWNASYLDRIPAGNVSQYRVWRQVPAAAALARVRGGASLRGVESRDAADLDAVVRNGDLLATTASGVTTYWELVGSQQAAALAQYSFTAPTTGDSIAGSNPLTKFMVQAWDGGLNGWVWNSDPDSGYSVDNLAPPTPAPFTAAFSGSNTLLQWGANANAAPDFAHYEVHRGVTSDFTPGPATQIAQLPDTSLLHPWSQSAWYKVASVDVHGNRSAFALASTPGTVDAPAPGIPAHLWLAPAAPNPARGAAVLRFGLPHASHVALELFDAAGRRVRVLLDGPFEPGEHLARWDGADDRGRRLNPGVYLVRLRADGRTLTERLARID